MFQCMPIDLQSQKRRRPSARTGVGENRPCLDINDKAARRATFAPGAKGDVPYRMTTNVLVQ